jgi:hypothetical protein
MLDDQVIVGYSSGRLLVFDLYSGSAQLIIAAHQHAIGALALMPAPGSGEDTHIVSAAPGEVGGAGLCHLLGCPGHLRRPATLRPSHHPRLWAGTDGPARHPLAQVCIHSASSGMRLHRLTLEDASRVVGLASEQHPEATALYAVTQHGLLHAWRHQTQRGGDGGEWQRLAALNVAARERGDPAQQAALLLPAYGRCLVSPASDGHIFLAQCPAADREGRAPGSAQAGTDSPASPDARADAGAERPPSGSPADPSPSRDLAAVRAEAVAAGGRQAQHAGCSQRMWRAGPLPDVCTAQERADARQAAARTTRLAAPGPPWPRAVTCACFVSGSCLATGHADALVRLWGRGQG